MRTPKRLMWIGLFLLSQIVACGGGGGGGGGGTPPPPPPPPQPSPEMLIGAQQIPPITSIGSDSVYVYLASQHELSKYNKVTGVREVLTGNLIDPQLLASCGEIGVVDFATDLIKDGDYLYFHSAYCERIQRIFTGNDGLSAIETIVPQAGLGGGISSLAGNDDSVFWTSGSTVYRKEYSSNNPAQTLTTIQSVSRLRATPTALYITANPLGAYSLSRYSLISNALTTIQDNIALDAYGNIPTATSASKFYWVNGNTIYSVSHTSSTPEIVVSGLSNITHVTADDSLLYALQGTLLDPNVIHRIDLAAKTSTPIVSLDDIRDVLVYNGTLYWVSGLGLYRRNPDGTTTELYLNNGSEIVIGGAGGNEMVGVSGKVIVSAGISERKLLFHDVVTGTNTLLQPVGVSFGIYANSNAVYYGTYNTGILKIPPSLNLRYPETLLGNLATVEKLFLDSGWLYWSEYSNFLSIYRVSRMRTDGSQYQVLFNGSHRGLALYNNRLYFMCESGCSLPSWTLVSMPLDGGAVVPEYGLALGPAQMIQKNGIFYVADTFDFGSMSIFSINLTLNDSMELVAGLPYVDIVLDASSNWFYRLQGGLTRHRINGWNSLGTPEAIDPSSDPSVFVSAMHTDGSNLYYWLWKNGLKRLTEQ